MSLLLLARTEAGQAIVSVSLVVPVVDSRHCCVVESNSRMRVVMGTRPTPPAATASSDQSSRVLDIKKESPDDEIKVRRSFLIERI